MNNRDFAPAFAHRMWRFLPPERRRAALARLTAWIAPRPDPVPPAAKQGLAVGGELSRASGLGESARLVEKAVRSLGLPVWTVDIPPPVDTACELPSPDNTPPPPGVPLVLHVNAPFLPLALLRMPRRMLRGRRIIGYWSWELPNIPPEWSVGTLFVHQVWAPSKFTADALAELLPGRVRVVPLPLAASPPTPAPLGRAAFGLPADAVVVFVSFNLASSFARKNPLAAVQAFRAAFGEREDRILIIKVGHPDHELDDFAALVAAAQAPNIRIETRLMPPDDHYALMAASDIVLSLHRSEGFGLVPAEAMLLGKPVIATGWSGNMEFMDRDNAIPVGYRLIPVDDPRRVYHNAVWAEPDTAEAVAALRHLADNAAARRDLGAHARATALVRLGTEPLAAALRDIGLPL